MSRTLHWGILGTGRIAGQFADDLANSGTGRLAAVAGRTLASVTPFAARYPGATAHASYEALLADKQVEAVYVATPHPAHIECAVAAAKAGKHVLCEKPLGLNHFQGLRMVEAARLAKVTLMEAFMYRCHPQTAKLVDWVRNGAIGEVRLVQANFGFFSVFDAQARLWSKALAGGGILDVGCYPISLARLLAGASVGKAFLDPVELKAEGRLSPVTGVDAFATAQLRFETGLVAQVATAISVPLDNTVRVQGTQGWIYVPSPWLPAVGGALLHLHRRDAQAPEIWTADETRPLYAIEADTFAEAVFAGRQEVSAMPWADTLGNLKTLDRWRAGVGVSYPGE